MKCPHCLGIKVSDACLNLNMEDDRNTVWIEEWRCLNCGEIFDLRTLENRALQREARHVRREQEAGRCLVV
jgi:Fe-S-cluster-containing hydrogenase component 2